MIKHSTQLNLIVFFLIISFSAMAVDDLDQIKIINHNWSELSQDEYIDNLVACELKLQEHKWSKNIWPKENKAPKPAFSEVVDLNQIRAQVLENLKMQSVLADYFNTTITDKMLQHDLNRMAKNTKDAKGLKARFALFDNNPNTIAQCISRPYLVKQKTQNNYIHNSHIHAETKAFAQTELKAYLAGSGSDTDSLKAEVNSITFEIEQDNYQELVKPLNELEEPGIKLSSGEFYEKVAQLQNNSLQEKDHGFYYTEILEQSDKIIKVKTLIWQKASFNLWLQAQYAEINQADIQNLSLKLPTITGSSNLTEQKAGAIGDTWESRFYVPDGRSGHTAIWSGSEMIVWGGHGEGGDDLNTGGRYDPITDSWQATSVGVDVPSARYRHTAIWTGTEMIIWGGYGNGRKNTGGRYNPVTDSWNSTSFSLNTPSGMELHTAVWSGSEMIVWGGVDSGGYTNKGWRYNPNTNSWQPTSIGANVPSERYAHTAIWSGNEMIIWGGHDGSYLNTGGRYDPISDSWLPTDVGVNLPSGRRSHTAIWSGNEMIVWGGFEGGLTNTGGRYNPINDSWLTTSIGADVPNARASHTSVWSGTEMIVWGGGNIIGGRYNPTTDNWQPTSTGVNVPSNRSSHTAIWTGSEMIIWGGSSNTNTGGRYNPVVDSWQSTSTGADVPSGRNSHTAIWTGNEMVVWGGESDHLKLNTGGRYDPVTDAWQLTMIDINTPSARYNHTAIWTGTKMIIWGEQGYSNTGGRYNPIADSWESTSIGANVPSGRIAPSIIWDGGEMIVWGGVSTSGYTNTGGRYDPVADSWQPTGIDSNTPSERGYHTAVWTGSEMIVWGGHDGNLTNSGGRYNPVNDSWQPTSIGANVPSARQSAITIWSGNEMIVWGPYTNTGGRYNPVADSWQPTSVGANVPSGRSKYSIIWSGSEMIVWGGYSTSGYTNTGGRYDPVSDRWQSTSIGANLPSGRQKHTAIWTGTEMIVWGGNTPSASNSLGIYTPPENSYDISGNLSGLKGNQVVLQNNGDDDLILTTDGAFSFADTLPEGSDYAVTVLSDPISPAQTCTVTNGSGTNIMADVTNVAVNCVNDFFNVGVTVSGLASGNSVFLKNNGDDLLEVSANGVLTNFATQIGNGLDYLITFDTQPTDPNQICSIVLGEEAGTVSGADVNVAVTCVTNQYNVNVNVTGLAGNSVSFNNGADTLTMNTNGTQTISTLDDGSAFDVDITAQPSSPNQICGFSNADSGNLMGANYTVTVACVTTQYDVNVTVTGLAATNSISFTNGTDTATFTTNTTQTISTLDDGSAFNVSISSAQPDTPDQVCGFTNNNSGNLAGGDYGVTVECITTQYSVGGIFTGLASGNQVILQNNGGDDLTVTTDGSFTFTTPLDDESAYAVTVLTNPTSPNQTCAVTGGDNNDGTGILSGGNETGIVVTCTTNQYSVGGSVSGLAAGNEVILQNNGDDDLTVSTDGSFTFNTPLDDESAYVVTVLTNPTSPNQTCAVTGGDNNDGTGTLSGSDETSIVVTCTTNQYSVGGSVAGLAAGNEVILQNNGGDDLTVSVDGSFTFATKLADASSYAVTVLTQPTSPNQQCTLTQGTGTLTGADVTNVQVNCVTDVHSIGGTVTGLANNNFVTLSMNAGDEYLVVNSNSAFTFLNPLADGSMYEVTVLSNPTTPNQSCTITNGSGNLQGADITDIEVECTINQYYIGGYINGLIPDNYMVLQNNLTDDLMITNQGAFAFSTPLDDQQSYDVTIQTQPNDPIQSCEVINGDGSLTGRDVENVFVVCEFGDDLIYRHGFDTPEAISRALWEQEE